MQLRKKSQKKTKAIAIQRSRGYSSRLSFKVNEIQKMCEFVKSINSEIIIFVDNCYGEFIEDKEPTEVGADLITGSLIIAICEKLSMDNLSKLCKSLLTCLHNGEIYVNFTHFVRNFENKISLIHYLKAQL
jgi:hypothetical protein